jgi:hypothetical protein
MLSFKRLSAGARVAAAAGGTLLAAGIAATPAASATAAPSPAAPWVVISVPFESQSASASSVCASNIPAHADHNREYLKFWYLKNGCIGTIRTTTYAAENICVNPQVRIYANGKRYKFVLVEKKDPKKKYFTCTKLTYYWNSWSTRGPSHHRYTNPIQVVGSAEFKGGNGELGPAKANG